MDKNLRARTRKVLVIEDERDLVRLISGYLEKEGFKVASAEDGAEGLALARTMAPDVVVLDLGLPGLDGIEVCRQLRTFSDCYVVMLTARVDEIDTLVGLSVGADDYMTKPFSPRELIARIKAMLRRSRQEETPDHEILIFGDLTIDPEAREVFLCNTPVALTRTEFDVLAALAERPRTVFTRRALIEKVWGQTWVGDDHLVDVHILHVRQKLGDSANLQRYVRTVRGVGYRIGDGSA